MQKDVVENVAPLIPEKKAAASPIAFLRTVLKPKEGCRLDIRAVGSKGFRCNWRDEWSIHKTQFIICYLNEHGKFVFEIPERQ